MLFNFPDLALVQIFLIALSIYWALRRNDDIPLLLSAAIFYFSSYRYWAVVNGISPWINPGPLFTIVPITDAAALRCLHYIVFGEVCLLSAYMLCQSQVLRLMPRAVDPRFLRRLRPIILGCGLAALPLVLILRSVASSRIAAGASGALGGGYFSLPPLAMIGLSTLLFCLWKFKGLPTWKDQALAGLILLAIANLTFRTSTRFQFLGWIIAGSVIFLSSLRPRIRLLYLGVLGGVGLVLLMVAGVMRSPEIAALVLNQGTALIQHPLVHQALYERLFGAVDGNMLDGMVILEDVYPRLLPFSFGGEHLEVLLRPIPRAIWPEKPVGGYMNKLGIIDPASGATLGYSPSIFGEFYTEAGVLGIFVLSILYGAGLGRLIRYSNRLHPFGAILVRAIVTAALVPLLRGGDLPGIVAWIVMAFWPCLVLLFVYRKYFQSYVPLRRPGQVAFPGRSFAAAAGDSDSPAQPPPEEYASGPR